MKKADVIVGIDLGTTNSAVAAFLDGKVQVLGPVDPALLPSIIGLTPGGELLVGEPARNQQLLYPERTIRSVKREMGKDITVPLAERALTPAEASSLILRETARWAREKLGRDVKKAVITVPAYFSDDQRQATREAGQLAGLEVVRILNEPTAASFAYGYGMSDEKRHTVLIYDLGGGTFDVSIVNIEGDITEVLATHGNNRLGGDDFDLLILEHLAERFREQHGVELNRLEHPRAWARLLWAAEEAKKKLSSETWVTIREEALHTEGNVPLHLEISLSRAEYEGMIAPLIEETLTSVSIALEGAKLKPADLDAVLLVGGSTRTPLVWDRLEAALGVAPRQDVHPDLCVALGAGVLASRLSGEEVQKVLVDITPYSFGVSHVGELNGAFYEHCYFPTIRRNTPIPVSRSRSYCTAVPYQEAVDVEVYQGDNPDARKNLHVGRFRIDGLRPTPTPNEVVCQMSLDIDGILKVSAIEKATGHAAHITIKRALAPKSPAEIEESRRRMDELYGESTERGETQAAPAADGSGTPAAQQAAETPAEDPQWTPLRQMGERLLERSRAALDKMHPDDKDEAVQFNERLEAALKEKDGSALEETCAELKDLLFYVEGGKG